MLSGRAVREHIIFLLFFLLLPASILSTSFPSASSYFAHFPSSLPAPLHPSSHPPPHSSSSRPILASTTAISATPPQPLSYILNEVSRSCSPSTVSVFSINIIRSVLLFPVQSQLGPKHVAPAASCHLNLQKTSLSEQLIRMRIFFSMIIYIYSYLCQHAGHIATHLTVAPHTACMTPFSPPHTYFTQHSHSTPFPRPHTYFAQHSHSIPFPPLPPLGGCIMTLLCCNNNILAQGSDYLMELSQEYEASSVPNFSDRI